MQAYTYLWIDFLTIIICFVFSFHKKIQFHYHFGAFLKGSILVAIPFIIWDVVFTELGVWWFDLNYTIGFTIGGLPLEEWLFFLCIPFACIFTYFCFDKFFNLNWANAFNNIIVFISIIVASVVVLLFYDRLYTLVTGIGLLGTLIYFHFFARVEWIGKASLLFCILMLGFFPVNGVLTGFGLASPIVNYNPEEFIGLRLWTIPIEDAVYGYFQFLWVLYFFKYFQKPICYEEK